MYFLNFGVKGLKVQQSDLWRGSALFYGYGQLWAEVNYRVWNNALLHRTFGAGKYDLVLRLVKLVFAIHTQKFTFFLPCGHLDFELAVTAQNDEFKADNVKT